MTTNYPIHEYALIFPGLGKEGAMELGESIREEGLLHPIVLYQGKILDGRNRYNACVNLKIEPATVEYTGDDPLGYVIKSNLHRRQLTAQQRAKVANRIAELKQGERNNVSNRHPCRSATQAEAAAALGVSERSVRHARKIEEQCEPEVNEAVDDGKLGLRPAAELAGKPREEQLQELERLTKEQRKDARDEARNSEVKPKLSRAEREWEKFRKVWDQADDQLRQRIREYVAENA